MTNPDNLIPLAEYAASIGRSPVSVRQKAARGALPGAVKIGRDWLVPEGTPYPDLRKATFSGMWLVRQPDGSMAIVALNNKLSEDIDRYQQQLHSSGRAYRRITGADLLALLKATTADHHTPAGSNLVRLLTHASEYTYLIPFNNPDMLTPEQYAEKMDKPLPQLLDRLTKGRIPLAARILDTWLIPADTPWPR